MIQFKIDKLKVKQMETRQEMGKVAADDASHVIRSLLREKEYINIIFAAAPSQCEFLKNMLLHDEIDFQRINAFHMDEYIGLQNGAPQSFGNFLKENIYSQKVFHMIYYINGQSQDPEAECERYARLLEENPVDIVFCGIGENGHLAFNDPPVADFGDRKIVKIVELDDVCRQQQVNDKCFASFDEVPKKAITLTIPALKNSPYIFSVVPSKTKARTVCDALTGPVSEKCPASVLRTSPNATLYLDAESASLLSGIHA